jgi:hypothetical protein
MVLANADFGHGLYPEHNSTIYFACFLMIHFNLRKKKILRQSEIDICVPWGEHRCYLKGTVKASGAPLRGGSAGLHSSS